ncbi:sensor histidine kinase [Bosea sp. BIWAKO-01]|uniref:sensor histidine kinase n=1 Tax=Bosea sp. BIWAKO-01 TaxID=506668 RepID=UPI0008537531|nr:sensor histidine kinase [Bosea sp. BIWAKO-01]GAU85527.1 integral membrane sensor signal transduction histidine kinase [Bosea sp. BIWAKO-01]
MARSLRGELLGWLLVPLAGIVAFNAWTAHGSAVSTANLVTDRMLLASARVIAEQVKESDGSVEALIPPSAIEMFATSDRDRVIYQVIAPSGELIAGFPDVAGPPAPPSDLQPVFFSARFRIDDIRAVALAQPVVSKTAGGNAIVIVGTTLRGRDRLVTELWLNSVRDQALLVGLAALLALFGLHRGLGPLLGLRKELAERRPGSLQPVETAHLQSELRPLIGALNHAFGRIERYVALQRRFVANASHQMRTPLAVLKTQSTVGLRETELASKDETLHAIDRGLDALARLVNQLLTLARAEPGGAALRKVPVDFATVTREALEGLAPIAFEREIDLAFDLSGGAAMLQGHETLLREIVVNLVENALRYTQTGGAVSVALSQTEGQIRLVVEDTGPGIPEEERERVFERFYRLPGAGPDGTGLGLPIVREIAAAHGGSVALADRSAGPGLRAEVRLPSLPAAAPDQS